MGGLGWSSHTVNKVFKNTTSTLNKGISSNRIEAKIILGDPGATSWDDAIFLGESLLQELKSPWELILTEPVPEVLEFRPADWAGKYFSAQSAMRSRRITLSPSYTK